MTANPPPPTGWLFNNLRTDTVWLVSVLENEENEVKIPLLSSTCFYWVPSLMEIHPAKSFGSSRRPGGFSVTPARSRVSAAESRQERPSKHRKQWKMANRFRLTYPAGWGKGESTILGFLLRVLSYPSLVARASQNCIYCASPMFIRIGNICIFFLGWRKVCNSW